MLRKKSEEIYGKTFAGILILVLEEMSQKKKKQPKIPQKNSCGALKVITEVIFTETLKGFLGNS